MKVIPSEEELELLVANLDEETRMFAFRLLAEAGSGMLGLMYGLPTESYVRGFFGLVDKYPEQWETTRALLSSIYEHNSLELEEYFNNPEVVTEKEMN